MTNSGITPFEAYEALWRQTRKEMPWRCLFVLPFWLQAVRRHLASAAVPHIVTVSAAGRPIGVVPLEVENGTARFIGNHEVCDYQDMIAVPGKQAEVLRATLNHLGNLGVTDLDLRTLRPDGLALDALKSLDVAGFCRLSLVEDEATYEIDLPDDWEGYLLQLNGKQRHEVRRKIRRLDSSGAYSYRLAQLNGNLSREVDTFMELFRANRSDKRQFMQGPMEDYFRELIRSLAAQNMLRLYLLEVADKPAAGVLCFDFGGVRYLYNSGYDEQYEELSVGVLSKVFSIRTGIESGCRKFDFLKGDEVYKRRIGGNRVGLLRALVQF